MARGRLRPVGRQRDRMARRSTTRRVLKWGGKIVCALLVGMFALSAWYDVMFRSKSYTFVDLFEGELMYKYVSAGPPIRVASGWLVTRIDATNWRERLGNLYWLPRVTQGSLPEPGSVWTSVWVPLWMPLIVIVLPTALLWWRDRRRIPPGHCQTCGYNLTGNVSGVCPECGTPIRQLSKGRP